MKTATDVPLALLLARASRVLNDQLNSSIGLDGVTQEHARVLGLLSDREGHTMGELAQRLDMNAPTLTKLVDRMVGQTLVQRGADPQDSRRVLVYATQTGRRLHATLQDRLAKHHAALAQTMGAAKLRQLERLLQLAQEACAQTQALPPAHKR